MVWIELTIDLDPSRRLHTDTIERDSQLVVAQKLCEEAVQLGIRSHLIIRGQMPQINETIDTQNLLIGLISMAYYYIRQADVEYTYIVSPSHVIVFHEASQHARAQKHLFHESIHEFIREEILQRSVRSLPNLETIKVSTRS